MKGLKDRCDRVFIDADELTRKDVETGLANAAAAHRLRSGGTALMALEACETRTSQALAQLHEEVSRQVEHRGRAWRRSMHQISEALEIAFGSWRAAMAPALKLARAEEGNTRAEIDHRCEAAMDKLRISHTAFADGWTAPPAKSWRERHVAWYALMLLVAGALVGEAVKGGIGVIMTERHPSANHSTK